MQNDCYILLGISSTADEKQIRKAWRLKSKEFHPDMNPSEHTAKTFLELTEAMNLLLDPTSRLKHDRHFGYYIKPKNQKEHNKQQFSEYQQKKAKETVNAWSADYEKAMRMREEQRMRTIRKYRKRRMTVLLIILSTLIISCLILLFRFN